MGVQKFHAQSTQLHALSSSTNSSSRRFSPEAAEVKKRRRSRIAGSVIQRPNGSWMAQRYVDAPDGSRTRRTWAFQTEEEAREFLSSLPGRVEARRELGTLGQRLERAIQMNEAGADVEFQVRFLRERCAEELTVRLDNREALEGALARILSRRAGADNRGHRSSLAVTLAVPVRKAGTEWQVNHGNEWKPITFRTHKVDALQRLDVALTRLTRQGAVLRTRLLDDPNHSLGFIQTLLRLPFPLIALVEPNRTRTVKRRTLIQMRQLLVRIVPSELVGCVPKLPRVSRKERRLNPEGDLAIKQRLTLAIGESGDRPSGEALERVLLAAQRVARAPGASPAARCVALIAATGLRSGEALELRWCDLDAASRMLTVDGTKTESAERRVNLEPKGMEELCGGLTDQLVAWRNGAPAGARMFDATGSQLGRALRAVTLEAGLEWSREKSERLWVHGLRHAFARYALWKGKPMPTLANHLGHSDWSFTARLYADSTSDPL